ncbi:MAG: hypothetical protein QOJ25_2395 [Solirubrobacteraceae bacterium]|jgi:hypothetical protein|nr:hypothetical protein [Solirubrobacteraceae bacterium]
MGLLDDAIREHLDLKRRRGADPTEVEREEREVLGPVRRRGEPLADDPLAHDEDLEHEPLPLDDAPWEDEPRRPAAAFDHEELEDDEPANGSGAGRAYAAPPRSDPYEPPEPPYSAGAPDEPDPYVPPVPPVPRPYPADRDEPDPHPGRFPADGGGHHDTDEQTAEFSVEDLHAAEGEEPEGAEEDVLEETPDFLQDTPDHDRLWFEQRPPRDFDFDG